MNSLTDIVELCLAHCYFLTLLVKFSGTVHVNKKDSINLTVKNEVPVKYMPLTVDSCRE